MKKRVAEDNFKQLAKNPANFDRKSEVFEQRPITLPDFEQPPTMASLYLQSNVSTQSVFSQKSKVSTTKIKNQVKVVNDFKAKTRLDLKQKNSGKKQTTVRD